MENEIESENPWVKIPSSESEGPLTEIYYYMHQLVAAGSKDYRYRIVVNPRNTLHWVERQEKTDQNNNYQNKTDTLETDKTT